MPESPYVAGLDPGLKAWLRMRQHAREIKERQGDEGLETTIVSHVKSRFHNYWIDDCFKNCPVEPWKGYIEPNEERVSLQKYRDMILAYKSGAIPADNILSIACRKRTLIYTDILISNDLNLNAPLNRDGKTMLHVACYEGDVTKMQYLLKKGASVRTTDFNGNTPLHLAVHTVSSYHPLVILETLIKYKVNVNIQNDKGQTALHLAAILTETFIINLLLQKKGSRSLNLIDHDGMRPVDHVHKVLDLLYGVCTV